MSEQWRLPERDRAWLMRTYSGHSSTAASNALYRENIAKGQTGLSIAFDLPTQCGYDPDDPIARGEVGKVGVPVAHVGDLGALLDGIPLTGMNTSMTINATAPWLFALYLALADEHGDARATLAGTTQNDILKEFLARGTFMIPPEASLRLATDLVVFAVREVPAWNPVNVCSYHLQEAGATPVQEVAFALANATALLDRVRARPGVDADLLGRAVGRISFFCNAGIRFLEEAAKMRAFARCWEEVCRERYGVTDPRLTRFRYGVQVNSLGLTEAQPENNVARIVLEALGVLLSRDARARSLQLPAWNEALGLPRPWDQQWSLRIQQVLAEETDMLEYADVFHGSRVIDGLTAGIAAAARDEVARIDAMGGAVDALEYMKSELVRSQTERVAAVERGDRVVVGVNRYTETAPSPLTTGNATIMRVDPAAEAAVAAAVAAWRHGRDGTAVRQALDDLRRAAAAGENVLPASVAAARAGVTTGEWGAAMREVFGEFRAPTGVAGGRRTDRGVGRDAVVAAEQRLGRKLRLLVGKPGLDGHSNGAEQIAVAARDAGFEVVYQGIRVSPAELARAAADEDVDVVGLSILSGSHLELVPEVLRELAASGVHVPVVVGGIIPEADVPRLRAAGVAAVYTPKDYRLDAIIADLAALCR